MDSTKLSLASERKLQSRRNKRDWTAPRGPRIRPNQSFRPFYRSEPYFPRQPPRRRLRSAEDSITELFHRISSYGGSTHSYFPVRIPETSLHDISVDTTIRFRSNLDPKLDSELHIKQELHAPSVKPESSAPSICVKREPREESSPLNSPNIKPESHERQLVGEQPFQNRKKSHKPNPFESWASNGRSPHRIDVGLKSEVAEWPGEMPDACHGDMPKYREDFLENKDKAGVPWLFLNSPKRPQRTFSGNLRTFEGVDAFGAR